VLVLSPLRCPFPGLEPFDEGSAELFLGRQADTLALLECLGRGVGGVLRRWLRAETPIGVGKSSLVRGGWADAGDRRANWTEVALRLGGASAITGPLCPVLCAHTSLAILEQLAPIQFTPSRHFKERPE